MMDRPEALAEIASLAREYRLSVDEIARALEGEGVERTSPWLRRLLAVLGGLLVLAGLVRLLELVWADLVPAARVLAVFGSGVVALALAIAAQRESRFERAVTPLLLVAAFFQAAGLFVLLDVSGLDLDSALGAILVFGTLAGEFACLFAAMRRTVLAFLVVAFAFSSFGAALAWLELDVGLAGAVLGLSGLLVSYGIDQTRWRGFTPLTWLVFAGFLTTGLFELVGGMFPFDLVLFAVAVLLIQVSVLVARRSLLVAAVVAMLLYLGYYTREYFADMLGWPIALILFGLILMALSGYAVRLGGRMVTRANDRGEKPPLQP